MSYTQNINIQLTNPFTEKYIKRIRVFLFAHDLIGTVRGKSANGIIIHSPIFEVIAIIDKKTKDQQTSLLCKGVKKDIPIMEDLQSAISLYKADALIFLIQPSIQWLSEVQLAIKHGIDIINTSFTFLKELPGITEIAQKNKVSLYDLRDVIYQKAYPNPEITERKCKVVYITGTDCGLGKRTAAYELTKEAKKMGINAAMYATGQTGLMLGERGTVVDALISEYSNGVVSQQVCQFSALGYDILFVEGQSDVFHPANSAVALSILHGANPDCLIIVHDEERKVHKGFEEDTELYQMHSLDHYIKTLEMLSLPCGPTYKTVGIATIGTNNINKIKTFPGFENMVVDDVLQSGGAKKLLDAILNYLKI